MSVGGAGNMMIIVPVRMSMIGGAVGVGIGGGGIIIRRAWSAWQWFEGRWGFLSFFA